MGLEEVGLEADRALVERLRLDQLVAAVVNVRQIDERRAEIRIELQRLSICRRRFRELGLVGIVIERRTGPEVLLGELGVAWRDRRRLCFGGLALCGGPAQRDDLGRRGLDAEVELELTLPSGHQRPGAAAGGGALP